MGDDSNHAKLIEQYTNMGWEVKYEGKTSISFHKPKKEIKWGWAFISFLVGCVLPPFLIVALYLLIAPAFSKEQNINIPL